MIDLCGDRSEGRDWSDKHFSARRVQCQGNGAGLHVLGYTSQTIGSRSLGASGSGGKPHWSDTNWGISPQGSVDQRPPLVRDLTEDAYKKLTKTPTLFEPFFASDLRPKYCHRECPFSRPILPKAEENA